MNDSSLSQQFSKDIRPLLDEIQKLSLVVKSQSIDTPLIVVVGDQSSGKTAVLNSLSGLTFPSGQDVTTRCPLMISLSPLQGVAVGEPRLKIGLDPNVLEEMSSCTDLPGKIETLTTQLADSNKKIMTQSMIYLRVEVHAEGPTLNLLDLPGITRNPMGDQPIDIYDQIKSMIGKFTKPEQSIILAVIPGTVDMSTCECIQLAKSVDMAGNRTIPIITKADQMSSLQKEKLQENYHSLGFKLGMVVVRNRSNEDIQQGMSISKSWEREETYFTQDTTWKPSSSISFGIQSLVKRLMSVQNQRIRAFVPHVRVEIKQALEKLEKQLKSLPTACDTTQECHFRIDSVVSGMIQKIGDTFTGNRLELILPDQKESVNINVEMIRKREMYAESLFRKILPLTSAEFTLTLIQKQAELQGTQIAPNLHHNVTHSTLVQCIKTYEPESYQLLDVFHQEVHRFMVHHVEHAFHGYQKISKMVSSIVQKWLHEKKEHARTRLQEIFGSEMSPISSHITFPYLHNQIQHQFMKLIYPHIYPCVSTTPSTMHPPAMTETDSTGIKSWLTGKTAPKVSVPVTHTPFESSSVLIPSSPNDCVLMIQGVALPVPVASLQGIKQSSSSIHNKIFFETQAFCIAYLYTAVQRLTDVVPMTLRYHMISPLIQIGPYGLMNEIQEEIKKSEDQLTSFMKEDPDLWTRRETIKREISLMKDALGILHNIETLSSRL